MVTERRDARVCLSQRSETRLHRAPRPPHRLSAKGGLARVGAGRETGRIRATRLDLGRGRQREAATPDHERSPTQLVAERPDDRLCGRALRA
jgi:hypothetical protein